MTEKRNDGVKLITKNNTINVMKTPDFNVRAYMLIINYKDYSVLVSDEFRFERYMTKFPGGGLNFGEGTLDCIHREAMEEFGQEVKILEHFYTTDFFQVPYHRNDQQLFCVYYMAKFTKPIAFKISKKPFDFPGEIDEHQSFRWLRIAKMNNTKDITFPIDQKVAAMLQEKFS